MRCELEPLRYGLTPMQRKYNVGETRQARYQSRAGSTFSHGVASRPSLPRHHDPSDSIDSCQSLWVHISSPLMAFSTERMEGL